MAIDTTIQQIQENPDIEAYRIGLLQDVTDFIRQNAELAPDAPVMPPSFQVAGLDPMQQRAAFVASQGVGAYQPYLDAGLEAVRRGELATEAYGLGGVSEGFGASRAGLSALAGTGNQFNPYTAQLYMNPFEDQVVDQAMADIDRGSLLQRQQLGAQAAATGAFGGSRQSIAEQELNRDLNEQKARLAGQLRMGGFESSQQRAEQAYENAQRRRQNQSQLAGSLGQGLGSLGTMGGQIGDQLSTSGLRQAGLGELSQSLNLGDVRTLEALGTRDRGIQQQILDAQRQSNLQMQQFPYQQFAFLSDIYKGTPSSQQVTQRTQTQDPSTFQQIAGLGIAGLSAAAGAKNRYFGKWAAPRNPCLKIWPRRLHRPWPPDQRPCHPVQSLFKKLSNRLQCKGNN